MRRTLHSYLRTSELVIFVGIACSTACAFESGFRQPLNLLPLRNVPLADLTSSDVDLVFEDPETIAVYPALAAPNPTGGDRNSR